MIERASKIATAASVVLIVGLLLWFHPDITPGLQAAGAVSLIGAWLAAGWRRHHVLAACVLAAPVAPALLRAAAGREQPVLDVVWMAALAGALVRGAPPFDRPRDTPSSERLSGWALPDLWRPLAGGWALVLALSWPVLVAREIAFDLDGLRDWGAVVSWAYWPAPHAVSWTLYWVLIQLLGLLWLERVRERFLERPGRIPEAVAGLVAGTATASVVAIVQGTVDLDFLNPDFWASLRRASGTMLEANGYGHAAALAGPVTFVILRSRLPEAPHWAWAALVVNWVGLYMSGSRLGSFLCGAAGAMGLAVAFWRSGALGTRRQLLAGAAVLVSAAAVLTLMTGAAGPIRRLGEISPAALDLWDRGGYGSVARQIVREYPLTGTGPGTFHYIAPDYERARVDDALAPDNAQNWWRHQAAELGFLGGAFVLLWSAVIASHVLAGKPGTEDPASPVVRSLLLGLGLSSLLGVPTQNPVVLLWFFLLVAWLTVLAAPPSLPWRKGTASWTRAAWAAGALLAIAYAGTHVLLARTSLSVADRARRFEREYIAGAHQLERFPDGREFRWTDDQSRFVLPARTPWLLVRIWASHPDIEERPVHVTLSNRCGTHWSGTLDTKDPYTIPILLEGDVRTVDATVTVERTWKPSAYGSHDDRELGVAISTSFRESPDASERQAFTVIWPPCLERPE